MHVTKYSTIFLHIFLTIIFFTKSTETNADERDSSLAYKYLNRGIYCESQYSFDSSLCYYNLAKNLYAKEKTWFYYSLCINNTGLIYIRLDNFKKANKQFDSADSVANNLVYKNSNTSASDILFLKYSMAMSRNQYDKVILYLEEYLKSNSKTYSIWNLYYSLGFCYYYLQDYENSTKAYFKAIKFLREVDLPEIQKSKMYTNIAMNYYLQSEFEQAIIYNKEAIKVLENNNKFHPDLSRAYASLGTIYEAKGDFQKTMFYLETALKMESYNSMKEYLYKRIGKFYESRNNLSLVEPYYEKAMKYAIADVNNKSELVNLLYYYGDLFKKLKQREKAMQYYKQALALSIKELGITNTMTSQCFILMGDLFKEDKNYEKALQCYESALFSLNPFFNSIHIFDHSFIGKSFSHQHFFTALKNKADVLKDYYKISHNINDLELSLKTYALLCYDIEKQRFYFTAKGDKSYITEKHHHIYCTALQLAEKLYRLTHNNWYKEQALKLAEQNKSALLVEQFNENNARNFGKIPADILEKENNFKRNISSCEKMIYEESLKTKSDPSIKTYWEARLFDLKNSSDTLATYIKMNFPDYHRLKYNPSVLTSKEIQKKLTSESAFIEYTMTDTALYIFAITKDKFEIKVQKNDLKKDIEMFEKCFNISEILKSDSNTFQNYKVFSYSLYEKLLKPVESLIENKKDLVIIPDEKLSMLPFEALIYNDGKFCNKYRNLPYLIKKYTMGYAQLATLFINQTNGSIVKNSLLAIAPEYSSPTFNNQAEVKELRSRGYNLGPIPGVIEEVKCLENIEGARIIFSEKATEGTFKKLQRKFDILHLAMHAIVDYKNPKYSKLIFSKSDELGEDGFLNLYELMNMNIGANLAILSACNTGSGNFLKGEGIMNLARGFFYAGCQSVIMTLWAVDDNSSSDLIKNFYKYFTKGKSKTEALRLAKIEFIDHSDNSKTHPYFWAGYVNIGDSSALYPSPNYKKIIIPVFLLLIGISLFILLFYKKGKSKNTID